MQPWQTQLVTLVFTFLGLVVTACVPLVARYIAKKYKLEGEAHLEDQLHSLADLGIKFAEEQANKRLGSNLTAPSGSEKMDMAVKFVLGQIEDRKLPQRGADAIKNLIEAKLPDTRPDPAPKAAG